MCHRPWIRSSLTILIIVLVVAGCGGGKKKSNTSPAVSPVGVTTPEDTTAAITLQSTDADGDAVTYAIAQGPAHGTLSAISGNRVHYTPVTNWHGTDTFTYTAGDGKATSAAGTVTVRVTAVNDVPVAGPVEISTSEDTAITIILQGTDVDGDAVTYAIAQNPAQGTLSAISGNQITYTPAPEWNGTDTFTYTASDGQATSAAGTVTVLVIPGGARQVLTLVGVTVPFRWCPPGIFTMGSPAHEVGRDTTDEGQYQVTLTQGFWLGETEVTQTLWKAVMNGANPSSFLGDQLPVETVSWNDCQTFLNALNAAHPGLGAQLPTEAQWEYAYRAGTTTALHNGTNLTSWEQDANLDPIAWYWYNANGATHVVGGKMANNWGLYDMAGNVWEWCADWYGIYPTLAVTDPTGPVSGSTRVFRGGSWSGLAWLCRAADRYGNGSDSRSLNLGFRFVVSDSGLASQVIQGDG